jgi:hypothetical protein
MTTGIDEITTTLTQAEKFSEPCKNCNWPMIFEKRQVSNHALNKGEVNALV